MKIYYYKQQQNTFELFDKPNSPFKLRFVIIGAAFILVSSLGYWKFKHRHINLPVNAPAAPVQIQGSTLDEETQATSMKIQSNIEQDSQKVEEAPTLKEAAPTSLNSIDPNMQTVTIKPHDTLSKIFSRLDINKKDAAEIMKAGENTEVLKKLQPGQKLTLAINDHHVQKLNYTVDPLSTLIITRTNNKFQTLLKTVQLEPQQTCTHFTVYGSIESSAKKSGLNSKRTAQLASIFKTSVDFTKGHTGDTVSVLLQDYYLDGKKVKEGEIVAAEYRTATNTYQAVRFTDPKGNSGYYSPDGTSLQKRFLPAPLKFTRISSLFNPKRWHPVLHRFRHHEGVDYAAPYGTPIKSVANGTIELLGRKGGYGNTIMIKHDGSYCTLYGHLSKYASGLKVGSHVQQGQLIGYVGSSGLATGPHLHFEFRINGVHRNPLTVALPNGKSITHAYRNKFHNEVKKLLAKLDAHKNSNSG